MKTVFGSRLGHIYRDNAAFVQGRGHCTLHGGVCIVPAPTNLRVATGGWPCQAYSQMRQVDGDTPGTGPVDEHPTCNAWLDFCDYLSHRRPEMFAVEQVEKFAEHETEKGNSLRIFCKKCARMGYSVRCQILDHGTWVALPRARLHRETLACKHPRLSLCVTVVM